MTGPGVVIGMDIGGTSVSVDAVDLDGRSFHSATRPTGRGEAAVAAIIEALTDAEDAVREAGAQLLGVGLISPGHLDSEEGIVHFASNLEWRDLHLRDRVVAAMREPAPVRLGNDARWAGIAEGVLGGAQGLDDYVLVSIGTGIAACLVSGGQVLTGAENSAGEFGHTTVVADGDRCACGRTGCIDAYASGAALARRYDGLGGVGELNGVPALIAGRADDPIAARVWEDAVSALARGLCTLTLTLDPERIVIAGGLSGAGSALTAPLRVLLEQQLLWKRAPELVISPLGHSTGRAGAVLLALTVAGLQDRAHSWDVHTVHTWGHAAGREAVPA